MRRWPALVLVLALPAPAFAIDLDDYLEAWTVRVDGGGATDDADVGHAVAITATDTVLVAGTLDGAAAGDGHDAFLAELGTTGVELWRETTGGGPADVWYDLALDPTTGDLAVCGAVGDPVTKYTVEVRSPGAPPTPRWTYPYQDGAQSDVQECRAVAWVQQTVYSAGWADSGSENGSWLSFRNAASDGATSPPTRFEDAAFEAVPDRANGLAVNTLDGSYVVVGERGRAGLPGSDLNDTDFHVQAYDPTFALEWQGTVPGPALLLDVAEDVVIENTSGDAFVVGWLNVGSDNATNQDRDWYVARFDGAGDGTGGAFAEWAVTWSSAPGADEIATAVSFDDSGDLLVAGTSRDPKTGRAVFTVARFAAYDGSRLEAWVASPGAGDMVPTALDFRSGLLAVAGSESNGTDLDLRVTLLDLDGDGDGVADAADACPDDSDKFDSPGVCGCGVLDQDTDGDTVLNCVDVCPADPSKFDDPGVCGCDEPDDDADGDTVPDCIDDCPTDPDKAEGVGECGCGSPETDTDGDGVLGCNDACSNTAPGERVDEFGCSESQRPPEPTEDTGDTDDGTDGGDVAKGGCGCDASGGSFPVALLLAAPLLRRRRR